MKIADFANTSYNRFDPSYYNKLSNTAFQRKVYHGDGSLAYSITVYSYDDLPIPIPVSFMAEVYFYLPDDDGNNFKVKKDVTDWNISKMEDFFEKLYVSMGCIPDPHND